MSGEELTANPNHPKIVPDEDSSDDSDEDSDDDGSDPEPSDED
jgi:hypothetical protein